MALDDVTIFELHFDGAQFGPREVLGAGASTDDEPGYDSAEESAGSGRGRVLALVALSVGLSLAAAVLARRLTSDGERVEIEAIGDVETVPEQ